MPALDNCQTSVIRALEKEGWQIEQAPLKLRTPERTYFIDLEASWQQNGTKKSLLLAEVKCFGDSQGITQDIYIAVGQYLTYRAVLDIRQIDVPLYLAIPLFAYEQYFGLVTRYVISQNRIKLIIVDMNTERIVTWME
jgi:hypothetical protein